MKVGRQTACESVNKNVSIRLTVPERAVGSAAAVHEAREGRRQAVLSQHVVVVEGRPRAQNLA